MILTEDQTLALLKGQTVYNCFLVKQRIGYPFFKNDSSPLGNIISFQAPVEIGNLSIQRAIIFCGELLNTSMFAGVCFHRVFLNQVGTILSEKINKECFVDEEAVVVDNKQATISILNRYKDNVLFHIILPEITNQESLYQLQFKFEEAQEFKQTIINSFNYLLHSLHLETQRDNF